MPAPYIHTQFACANPRTYASNKHVPNVHAHSHARKVLEEFFSVDNKDAVRQLADNGSLNIDYLEKEHEVGGTELYG